MKSPAAKSFALALFGDSEYLLAAADHVPVPAVNSCVSVAPSIGWPVVVRTLSVIIEMPL